MAKLDKQSVNYRIADEVKRSCETCVMSHIVRTVVGTCDLVEGDIFSWAVCDRWEARTSS